MNTIPMKVTEGLTVAVIPNSSHHFLMSSKDVAKGYGINLNTLRMHRKNHSDELIEGKHYLRSVNIIDAGNITGVVHTSAWTKYGIIRLGFFIKSDNAKRFRDWAEDLIINHIEKKQNSFNETEKKLQERYLRPPEYDEEIAIIKSAIMACGSANKLADRIGMSSGVLSLIKSRPWLVSDEMLKGIIRACRNLLARDAKLDEEVVEGLLMIENGELRISLYNKMKRGGLI